jgi:hypothetical protein
MAAEQQQALPSRQHQSLPRKLEHLQRTGRFASPPFSAVPPSGLLPIEGLVDESADLKSECWCLAWLQPSCKQGSECSSATPPTATCRCLVAAVVLLGFTRDGGHLVSYTTQPVAAADAQDGYCLQLWRFQPGVRCIRLWSVPLFRLVGAELQATAFLL